jgi:RNA polymerase sigma-70 factor, ECF subfamily
MSLNLPENDKEFSSLLKRGEKKAFVVLFENYSQKIFRFANAYLKCREDAEEVVQEVFIKIWERRGEIKEDLSLNSFLFTIAYNITLNIIRKRKNGVKAIAMHVQKSPKSHEHVEQELLDAEYAESARVAIAALPPQRRRIYTLSREHHLTYKEIGEQLHISPRTVEVHMLQALKDIRKHLVRLGISLLAFIVIDFF